MKKYTLTALSLLLTASAAYAGSFNLTADIPQGSRNAMDALANMVETPVLSRHATVFKTPLRETGSDLDNNVIYEAPEGRVEHYSTSGTAYMAIMGMVGSIPVENFDTEMVFCDNGEVYWKNSITQLVPNSYLKGTDLGDRIEFTLPQCAMSYPDETGHIIDIYVQRMAYTIIDDATGEGWFFPDKQNNTVTLFKDEDGSLRGDVYNGEAILGMTTPEGEWYGYGNYDIVMTPGLETPIEIPDNLVTEEWQIICEGVGKPISVAFDGDNIYLTDLFEYMPDTWVVGHIDGNTITFPGHQYFGTLDIMMCSAYFEAISIEYNEEYDDYMPVKAEQALCTYDAEKREIKADKCFALMGGPGYLFEYYVNPEIRWQPAEFEINLPNPRIIDSFNYDDHINYGVVAFNLPALTKEGYVIDPEYISYRMFVDGEEFIFQPDEYQDLTEEMTWLPYLMNNYDIHCEGEYHQIDHYLFDVETFGIQAKYDDGTTVYMTDIVTVTTTGACTIAADMQPTSTEYHDLSGRRVTNPANGFFIRTSTYPDGSIRTSKVLVRK